MEIFLFWLLFSIVVGVIAGSRGRSGAGWFLLAVVISPLLALILVALLPSVKATAAPEARAQPHVNCPSCGGLVPTLAMVCKHCNANLVRTSPAPEVRVKCPDCAELVLAEAKVCKHCGKRFDGQPLAA